MLDGPLNVVALVVRGRLMTPTGGAAADTYLCAGYVVAEGRGEILLEAPGSQLVVYIKNNNISHPSAGFRVFGGVHGGVPGYPLVHLAGRALRRTWTLLAETAASNSTVLLTMHNPLHMGWRVGDRVALAPTAYQSRGLAHATVITALTNRSITLRNATVSAHMGSDVMRAELINLERTLLITGDNFEHVPCGTRGCVCSANQPVRTMCTMGLHTILMGSSSVNATGRWISTHARFEKCGQRGSSATNLPLLPSM
jgi:hypothetical protein